MPKSAKSARIHRSPLRFFTPAAQVDLPPTARRLLEAAHRLLTQSGVDALSVEGISREAGESKSLISYYFGSKAGLLGFLVDWMFLKSLWRIHQRLLTTPEDERVAVLTDAVAASLIEEEDAQRLFLDMLPVMLRDPACPSQLSETLRAYRDVYVRWFWEGPEITIPKVVVTMAAMTSALIDGLSIQHFAESGSVDVAEALSLWEEFVEQRLGEARASASKPPP